MLKQKLKKKIQFRLPFENLETGKTINVTVFEPEDKPEADPNLLLNAATTCWEAIAHDKEADAATKLLDASGCHWVLVLAVVEYYCRHFQPGEKAEHVKFTKSRATLNKKIEQFASRVTKWEAEIHKMNSEIEAALPIEAATHIPDFPAYSVFLNVAAVMALPSMMDLTRKKDLIVFLYHLAKSSTRRAHYKELVDIIQARLNADSEQTIIDERRLKAAVKRFKREDPAGYRKSRKTAEMAVKEAAFAAYQLPPAHPVQTRRGQK